MKVPRECEYCGSDFVPSRHNRKARACSRRCGFMIAMRERERPVRTCPTCQTSFTPYPSLLAAGGGKFCSMACYRGQFEQHEDRTCEECGESFQLAPYHAKRDYGGRFCSQPCYAKARKTFGSLDDPDYFRNWRARNRDKVAESSARRSARIRGASVVEVIDRSAIIARDDSRCHFCGKRCLPHEIHLDHLIPVSWTEDTEHTPRNLAVACAGCNMKNGAGRLPAQLRLIG